MEFLTIFGKVVAKNRAFRNNIIFTRILSISGGGNVSCVPPWRRLYCWAKDRKHVMKFITELPPHELCKGASPSDPGEGFEIFSKTQRNLSILADF